MGTVRISTGKSACRKRSPQLASTLDGWQVNRKLFRAISPLLGSGESRTLHYQSSVIRFYNNLQDRGDCQAARKSYNTPHVVGWIVGWKKPANSEAVPRFISEKVVSGQLPGRRLHGHRVGQSVIFVRADNSASTKKWCARLFRGGLLVL